MLIKESHVDVQASADGKESSMRIFLFQPTIPGYPNARFPGVALFSEIYQVTGPVARFARQIAGQGYIVAAPSSYHDFAGPEPLAYDVPGTDQGNAWKVAKTLASYDEDSRKTVDALLSLPNCTGRIGTTGMCLGGHLALRAALDSRVHASVCYFATDVHSRTLGAPSSLFSLPSAAPPPPPTTTTTSTSSSSPHTIDNLRSLRGETSLIFGLRDPHVPDAGRDAIRLALREAGATFGWHEFAWAQHAFIRDELSKGRYDAAITLACFGILTEVFGRVLRTELGEPEGGVAAAEHVC